MREQWAYAAIIACIILLTILYPSVGWLGRSALFRDDNTRLAYDELVSKNQALEALLATKTAVELSGPSTFAGERTAFVLSRYPLNFKNELLVNTGSNQGTRVGDVAIVPVSSSTIGGLGGIFLGRVTQVFENSAVVQTVFDANFSSAVRISETGLDALLNGGASPRLSLIPRRAGVKQGAVVYAASPNIPYGLAVGTIDVVSPSRDNVFDEATLVFGYDINQLTVVHLVPAGNVR